jgi:hypothetical protein
MRRTETWVAGLIVASLTVACAQGGGPGGGGGDRADRISHPTGADQMILRVDIGGGFVPIEYMLRAVPGFSLMGDGRVIVTGPVPEIYPGQALPNLIERRLDEDGIQAVLRAARTAGLVGPDRRYADMTITDAPTTTFTVQAGGQRHVTSAYALGIRPAGSGEDRAALERLVAFQASLSDLPAWLPAGSFSDETPYRFDAVRVFVRPYDPGAAPDLEQPRRQWTVEPPLAELDRPANDPAGTRCALVEGQELDTIRPALESSNELTPWRSGGGDFLLVLRPLLPDERGCSDG